MTVEPCLDVRFLIGSALLWVLAGLLWGMAIGLRLARWLRRKLET